MSPGRTGTTRQMRRDARRRSEKALKAGDNVTRTTGTSGSASNWVTIPVIAASLFSLALTAIAWAVDIRSFQAVASPDLYCWMTLCGVVFIAGATAWTAIRGGVSVPWYFWTILVVGAVVGAFLTKPAWRILTKDEAEAPLPLPAAHIDLRNELVNDKSFAERNLRRSELSGATFRHVDLSGADLSESDLRNASFEDVDLSGANLCGVDLRGADLRGAHGIGAVEDWSYVFYDRETRVPRSRNFTLSLSPGPIPDTGRDLLYMCKQDITRRIKG